MTDIDYQSFIRAIDSGYPDLQKAAIALLNSTMLSSTVDYAEHCGKQQQEQQAIQ